MLWGVSTSGRSLYTCKKKGATQVGGDEVSLLLYRWVVWGEPITVLLVAAHAKCI